MLDVERVNVSRGFQTPPGTFYVAVGDLHGTVLHGLTEDLPADRQTRVVATICGHHFDVPPIDSGDVSPLLVYNNDDWQDAVRAPQVHTLINTMYANHSLRRLPDLEAAVGRALAQHARDNLSSLQLPGVFLPLLPSHGGLEKHEIAIHPDAICDPKTRQRIKIGVGELAICGRFPTAGPRSVGVYEVAIAVGDTVAAFAHPEVIETYLAGDSDGDLLFVCLASLLDHPVRQGLQVRFLEQVAQDNPGHIISNTMYQTSMEAAFNAAIKAKETVAV